MRADEDVDLARRAVGQNLFLFFFRNQTAQELDADGILRKPRQKILVMLQREHRRGHQNRHLLGIEYRLHRRPQRDFRLTKPNITAQQAIHRALAAHIGQHLLDRALLIRRLFKGKQRLERAKIAVGRTERVTLSELAPGIEIQKRERILFCAGLRFLTRFLPGRAPELIDMRRRVAGPHKFLQIT